MKKFNYTLKITYAISVLMSISILFGCGQDAKIGLDPTDNIAPGVPTDITVKNIDGGAFINFKAPLDDDLLCVVATYDINGIERTTKASPFSNELLVEGFGKAGTYTVVLKSVDKSKNESTPVEVVVNPTTPPVENIFNSLKVIDSFGGIKLSWENETEANIIVEVSKKNGEEWESVENFYSNAKKGSGSLRGFEPEPITFRFRIRDRWDNYSNYKETNNLPILEEQLDKSKFKEVIPLSGDTEAMGALPIRNIWDGNNAVNCFHGIMDDVNRAITFDMGQVAKLSRFKMWQRTQAAAWIYSHNNLKRYDIYGCTEITEEMRNSGTEVNGMMLPDFEGWTLIKKLQLINLREIQE
jgi:hypothetical protein